uniref:Uncharacterized protein n=1 Tax=Anopheles christyi TaxID=43041 RepID=A0A182KII2_9DIPT
MNMVDDICDRLPARGSPNLNAGRMVLPGIAEWWADADATTGCTNVCGGGGCSAAFAVMASVSGMHSTRSKSSLGPR